MPITISLCMIVKNEEKNLSNCLDSIHDLVDEINIIDTGSTDKTIEIAKKYTERIFHFDWIDDFSAARNFSFSKASMDYIMWLDADDIIQKKDRELLKEFAAGFKGDADCIMMPYIIGTNEKGEPSLKAWRERIVRRNKNFKWVRPIHEKLSGSGVIQYIDASVTHTNKENDNFKSRNFAILEKTINSPGAEPLDHYYYGLLLSDMGRHEEAVKHLDFFIKNNDNPGFTGIDAFISIYNSYISLKEYENAYKILSENEAVNKDKSEYYCLLGFFIMNFLKDYNLAEKQFIKALNCSGKEANMTDCLQRYENYYYFQPWNFLGQCHLKQQNYKEAKNAFKKALEFDFDNQELININEKLSLLLKKQGAK